MKLLTNRFALVALFGILTSPAQAAAPTGELQKAVRNATFEVVMPKPVTDTLTYEKPLPLELIPFTERNDKYWSIGTAFAVDNHSFVSAAHVLMSSLGSRLGVPALRDATGKVYPIDRILKFSLHEDFVVFSVQMPPTLVPLNVNREPHIDDAVFAVGNALGDGIVIRDGLFTSETAEQQDGRWKWIRFSAAASPGNSGGPLLDATGRVIGIVIGKSDNENLNYALPIGRLSDAPPNRAAIDTRWLQSLPFINATSTATFKQSIDLPKSVAEFSTAYLQHWNEAQAKARSQLLASSTATLFPRGAGARELLADVRQHYFPRVIKQRADDHWDAKEPENIQRSNLTGNGFIQVGYFEGVALFRLLRPKDSDDSLYKDSKQFMDLAIKGLQIARPVGTDSVRVTSLGKATTDTTLRDAYGRVWQLRAWPLDFNNSHVVAMTLPTPDGYVGMIDQVGGILVDSATDQLKLLADLFTVSYAGTLPQWRSFLARKELRPAAFESIKIDADFERGLRYESKRVKFSIPSATLKFQDRSQLVLHMAYTMENDKLTWDVGGIASFADEDGENYLSVTRHTKPDADAKTAQLQLWEKLRTRTAPYDNLALPRRAESRSFWIATAASAQKSGMAAIDASTTVLYDVSYGTADDVLPRDVEERHRLVVRDLKVLER